MTVYALICGEDQNATFAFANAVCGHPKYLSYKLELVGFTFALLSILATRIIFVDVGNDM